MLVITRLQQNFKLIRKLQNLQNSDGFWVARFLLGEASGMLEALLLLLYQSNGAKSKIDFFFFFHDESKTVQNRDDTFLLTVKYKII